MIYTQRSVMVSQLMSYAPLKAELSHEEAVVGATAQPVAHGTMVNARCRMRCLFLVCDAVIEPCHALDVQG